MGEDLPTPEGATQAPLAGAIEAPPDPPSEGVGFDAWVLGVLVVVLLLVSLQNLWLRRKADRENADADPS